MSLKLSTVLRNEMLKASGKSFDGAINGTTATIGVGSYINIYKGTEPVVDASLASLTSDLLCTIRNTTGTAGDYNCNFVAPTVGTLTKDSDIWTGVNAASGTATYFRLVYGANGVAGAWIQGDVSTSGAVLNISNPALTSGAAQNVDYFSLTLPGA